MPIDVTILDMPSINTQSRNNRKSTDETVVIISAAVGLSFAAFDQQVTIRS